jgi:hypothetical protein
VARAPIVWRLATVAGVIEETPRAETILLDVPGCPGHSAGQHGDERARNSPGPDRHGEQMAGVRAFLASDDGAYITGQTIFVDGGLTLTPTSASRGRLSERRLDDHVFVLQASEPTQSSKV